MSTFGKLMYCQRNNPKNNISNGLTANYSIYLYWNSVVV